MQPHPYPPMTPRHRVFLAVTVLMVLTVIGLVIGCDSDDGPKVTAPAPSGGGNGGNNGGNGQAAVEFDATAKQKGQQCGSASSTEIRNTCSDVALNVRVQCVTATGQPFGSVQHLRLAPGAAMPGDPLGCTGSGGETLQAPSLARSSHVELLTIRSNYCPDPYLYIYGDITNGRLKFSEKGTGGCIHPDKLNTEQRRSEMVPTEPTAPIPSFEEVKETKRYKPTNIYSYRCGSLHSLLASHYESGGKSYGARFDNHCPFAVTLSVRKVHEISGRILETKSRTVNPGENGELFLTDQSGDHHWNSYICRPPGQVKFITVQEQEPSHPGYPKLFGVGISGNGRSGCYPSVSLYDDPSDDSRYELCGEESSSCFSSL